MSILGGIAKSASTVAAPYTAMLAPFWPLIWRAALFAVIFWAGWHYGGKEAERDLQQFKTDQAIATASAVGVLAGEVAARQGELTKQEIESATTIAGLKAAQAATPPPSLRVCVPARPRAVPGVPGAAAGNAADAGGVDGLPAGVGIDIGGRVQKLVDRAVIVRAKCLNQEERSDFLSSQKPMTIPVK